MGGTPEILAPNRFLAGKGPGSVDKLGRKITSNSISAVMRLVKDGVPMVLLPGDLDSTGFKNLIEHQQGQDILSSVIVYPHHGGRAGGDDAVFAREICEIVSPDSVIFSIGRGRHGTPRPNIVEAIMQWDENVRIACTQLSDNCANSVPSENGKHLFPVYSKGYSTRQCCAGTIIILLSGDTPCIYPALDQHSEFVEAFAPNALCLQREGPNAQSTLWNQNNS